MAELDFKEIGATLSVSLKPFNFQVAPAYPGGSPGKVEKQAREYRLQLVNKNLDTSETLKKELKNLIPKVFRGAKGVTFNQISPNSSKFSSYSFEFSGKKFDLVIAKGANKGENFETNTIANLSKEFNLQKRSPEFEALINSLNESNKAFGNVEIVSVTQRKGSTKKEGVAIENLGAIIGDIVLTDSTDNKWYISLKDVNGDTFSSYSGAASIFNAAGDLQDTSPGAEFLRAFGVDLNQVQLGFDQRNKKTIIRPKLRVTKADPAKIKKIFERAWGMNYFYVRKKSLGWDVFWIDRAKLNNLTDNIRVTEIKYPSASTKQITIKCENNFKKYTIELRNSSAGEYPNDTKFKVR